MLDQFEIQWDTYKPSALVLEAVAYLNHRTLDEVLAEVPAAKIHTGNRAVFDYRIYSKYDLDTVEKVYVLINGFAEPAATQDSGIKNLLSDLLLRKTESRTYAVLVVGGLFSFPTAVRMKLRSQRSGALAIIADEVAGLLQSSFSALQVVTVSGYSLGGVLAPLVARAIDEQNIATISQVCCGEPNYVAVSSSRLALLKRVSRATSYRNDQIKATDIHVYISVKKTPESGWAMLMYRAQQYRPLFRRLLSMRLVVQDLALQANDYPATSHSIQIQEALTYLANKHIRINLLHAEFSPLCHSGPFMELVNSLITTDISLITVRGVKADHGIEEYRTLSAPFLVMPETYWPMVRTTL